MVMMDMMVKTLATTRVMMGMMIMAMMGTIVKTLTGDGASTERNSHASTPNTS